MHRLHRRLRLRLRSLFQRARYERDLDAELQFHVDMLTAQHVRAGLSPEAARRAALGAFGCVAGIKDDVRDTWLPRSIETVAQDLRYGLRTFAAAPSFAAGLVVTIALAVGVNTSVFGLAYALLVKPLPFARPEALTVLRHGNPEGAMISSFSPVEIDDYRRASAFDGIAELHSMWFILMNPPGADGAARHPHRVSTGVVSAGYFGLLGIDPLHGRTFTPDDEAAGAPAVLVLSHGYWKRAFAGDSNVVGRLFEMNDRPHRVVGVLPPFPAYPEDVDVYMPTSACPFRMRPEAMAGRDYRMSRALARLRPGATLADAQRDLGAAAAVLQRQFPDSYGDEPYGAIAAPLEAELRTPLRTTLLLLAVTAALVLLIACVSVSNLALARLTYRADEVSLRAALGATRGRIIRQLVTENAAAVAVGAMVGLAGARIVLATLTGYLQRSTTLTVDTTLNGGALAAAVAVSVALLFGSAALPLARRRAIMLPGLPRLRPGRIRYGLVATQVALSFVLTAAAALSVRSLLHLQGIDVGFNTGHVQTMRVDLNFTKYDRAAEMKGFWSELERRLTAIDGVVAAGGAGTVPLDGRPLSTSTFRTDTGDIAPRGVLPRANLRVASPGYFAALGQRFIEGRSFTRADSDEERPVVVVNHSLVSRRWPGQKAAGRTLRLGQTTALVVGVVEDTRQRIDEAPGEEIYLPLLASGQLSTNWLVRSDLTPAALEATVEAIVREMDPDQPVDNFRTLESFRSDWLLPSRMTATVVGLFSVLALAITTSGIVGVLGFSVQQRRREFGVRLALGARRSGVVALVVFEGLRLVAGGLAWGILASLALAPLMPAVLAGIAPIDYASLAAVAVLLLAVAAAACVVPARRAARLDPLAVLRSQ